jgi:starvation-inducible outer membrane lipoprotein
MKHFATAVLLMLAGCTTSPDDPAKLVAEFRATCDEIVLTRQELVEAGYRFEPRVKRAVDEASAICTDPPADLRSGLRKLTVRLLILSQAKG